MAATFGGAGDREAALNLLREAEMMLSEINESYQKVLAQSMS